MKAKLRLATRKSPMALWQANHVKAAIVAKNPNVDVELVELVTRGDKDTQTALTKLGGKSVFVKELQMALLQNEADIAVHSIKDMSVQPVDNLILAVICERHDPRDAFVAKHFRNLDELPKGAVVGTGSPRRVSLIKSLRPDLETKLVRGNVNTRIQKLDDGLYDALILAASGLKRINMQDRICQYFDETFFTPAIGQGALGIECRSDDKKTLELIQHIHHEPTAVCVLAERAVNLRLGGDCHTAIGAHAKIIDGKLNLQAMVGNEDGTEIIRSEIQGLKQNSTALGLTLADDLIAKGAKKYVSNHSSPRTS